MTEPSTRPAPPPLATPYPICSLCGEETSHDGEGFVCEPCGAWWDPQGFDEKPGEWVDPDEAQCAATVQPLADNPKVTDEARTKVSRCARGAGHDGPHASVDYTYSVRGWKW